MDSGPPGLGGTLTVVLVLRILGHHERPHGMACRQGPVTVPVVRLRPRPPRPAGSGSGSVKGAPCSAKCMSPAVSRPVLRPLGSRGVCLSEAMGAGLAVWNALKNYSQKPLAGQDAPIVPSRWLPARREPFLRTSRIVERRAAALRRGAAFASWACAALVARHFSSRPRPDNTVGQRRRHARRQNPDALIREDQP